MYGIHGMPAGRLEGGTRGLYGEQVRRDAEQRKPWRVCLDCAVFSGFMRMLFAGSLFRAFMSVSLLRNALSLFMPCLWETISVTPFFFIV